MTLYEILRATVHQSTRDGWWGQWCRRLHAEYLARFGGKTAWLLEDDAEYSGPRWTEVMVNMYSGDFIAVLHALAAVDRFDLIYDLIAQDADAHGTPSINLTDIDFSYSSRRREVVRP